MVVLKPQHHSVKEHALIVPLLKLMTRPISALIGIHQRYGERVFVRFLNSKLLFVCHPEHIGEVYNQESKGLLSRDFMYDAKKLLFGDGLVNSKNDLWVKQRRLMQPLFTREAIVVWSNLIIQEANKFTDKLKKSTEPDINLSDALKRLIQTLGLSVLFGQSADTVKQANTLIKSLDIITRGLAPHLVTEILGRGKLKWLFPVQAWRLRKAVTQLTTFVNQAIANHYLQPGYALITLLIQANDKMKGYRMPPELLKDEVVNLFFAGQDTTLNTLSWFFYLIGKHERVHLKISQEVGTFKDDPLTVENLAKLSYTKAALYETLRLYPPTTALATRALEDVVIGGQTITQGTTIILSMYATHRHAMFWERPDEFYPEHFANPLASERHKYAFFPFGGGLHNCIGRRLAELEMMIIIVTLLRAFTLKTDANLKEAVSITLKPARDVRVVLTPIASPAILSCPATD